ncbi:MAG TPA: hypothetical protein VJT16_12945, partial [Streptosporangiaceae bacterium]|nr:hypothetical protein [Streptosporangiaceae bacterium]
MSNQDITARALADAAADAMNSGLAAGRVSGLAALSALMNAMAHSPGLAARCRALGRDLAGVAAGTSAIAPARGDRRFTDPAWQQNPLYRRIGQAYLAAANAVTAAVDDAPLDWRRAEQARFAAGALVSAMAPTNTLPGNPAACRRAFDTGGLSLLRGARNLVADAAAGLRTPRQVDRRSFKLGENIGATP